VGGFGRALMCGTLGPRGVLSEPARRGMRDKRGWPAQERYCELPVLLGLLAALHFGVADFARLDQRRDAGMGQVVAVLMRAVS